MGGAQEHKQDLCIMKMGMVTSKLANYYTDSYIKIEFLVYINFESKW